MTGGLPPNPSTLRNDVRSDVIIVYCYGELEPCKLPLKRLLQLSFGSCRSLSTWNMTVSLVRFLSLVSIFSSCLVVDSSLMVPDRSLKWPSPSIGSTSCSRASSPKKKVGFSVSSSASSYKPWCCRSCKLWLESFSNSLIWRLNLQLILERVVCVISWLGSELLTILPV